MTLFAASDFKSKARTSRPGSDRRPRRVLPTGTPRLLESSTVRRSRLGSEAWQALLDAVRRSATTRVDLLMGRKGSERIECSWKRLTGCDASCRCGGAGTVTVDFLRDHYASLVSEIEEFTRPMSRRQA